MTRLAAVPLTGAGFAAFGEVVEHDGAGCRHFMSVPLEVPRAELKLWTSRIEKAVALPFRVTQLERHPRSAQTFMPMLESRFLVVVAPPSRGDAPDLDALRAFVAGPGQGIAYRAGTWHHGMVVLDAPGQFAVMMGMAGTEPETELWDLPAPLEVVA